MQSATVVNEDLLVGGREQPLRLGDAVVGEVIVEGGPERLLEQGHGVVRMQLDMPRDVLDGHLYPATFHSFVVRMDWAQSGAGNRDPIVSDRNYLGIFWNSQGADQAVSNLDWINAHVRTGHGPLGDAYPESGASPRTPGVIEGSSCSKSRAEALERTPFSQFPDGRLTTLRCLVRSSSP